MGPAARLLRAREAAPNVFGPQASVSTPPVPGQAPAANGWTSSINGPHKPGVWQRMKTFFSGGGSTPRYSNWNPYPSVGYPTQMYSQNPMAPYQAMQTMLATQMLVGTLSTALCFPMMYSWSPVGFMGGFGAFPGMIF